MGPDCTYLFVIVDTLFKAPVETVRAHNGVNVNPKSFEYIKNHYDPDGWYRGNKLLIELHEAIPGLPPPLAQAARDFFMFLDSQPFVRQNRTLSNIAEIMNYPERMNL